MRSYELELFADYFQFYIQDDKELNVNLADVWTDEAVANRLAESESIIGVGTARNMDVPVSIHISKSAQVIAEAEFDLINQTTILCESGMLVIAGCTDYFPEAMRIELTPGKYNVQIGYKNLEDISEDKLDGNDSYHIWLSLHI
ncbi:hypothetical protein [Pseudoalteromonas luteoviolacea]|uniref:Uncharacterized protein n=1 Tax=Pseudoalteromonas luteoviolacea DSM 6061 TaxID=1365250 RepID=A0A166WBU3_9GAMM|nr:hypothetical protein [Pseudoalteromonas luteoviolacea]KZN37117.1 hypothetical protein N475_17015 [Pseudoalteromonas luteoviolacea DSM 6061]KZN52823.1 hypothetical protein N474_22375 [Pseudoalteromonas luteoviolacea CPMOR-2]MBE0389503.1 hypothetical protein [Pseudoalteromonas luteoviolacea DSM 6061]TQF67850.1 hypothetical protein FLM44_21970 [Pseudoalteromonas luteoviolacea]